MSKISWIHIIDNNGKPILIYEGYIQGAKGNNQALISHFLYSIKNLAKDLKEGQIKTLTIGPSKFFILKKNDKKFLFIIKTALDVNLDEVIPIMDKIKLIYNEKYAHKISKSLEENLEILESFKSEIWKILNLGKKYLDFLTSP